MRRLIVCVVLAGVCGPVAGAPAPLDPGARARAKAEKAARERVGKLFRTMRDGQYEPTTSFPAVTWDDIPALLGKAPSRAKLKSFPHNLLSSSIQLECEEGVLALWLIEGVRQGGKCPSLNPRLSSGWRVGTDSERVHRRALLAYREWWKKVKGLPREKAAAVNPLGDTNLWWY